MNRTMSWVAAAIAAGVAGGAAVGYWEARPWTLRLDASSTAAASAAGDGAADSAPTAEPRAVVPETIFPFGNMESGATQQHAFPIRNTGGAPLNLTFVSHTCKCTEVRLEGKKSEIGDRITVPPNGETDIRLEWAAKVEPGPFRHGASFETNDPNHSRIELTVEGEIVKSTTLQPSSLYFPAVHVSQPGKAELVVMAYLEPEVKITSHEVVDEELARHMDISFEPVAAADLPNPAAKAAVKVIATYKPEGMLGTFAGSLRIETNIKRAPSLEVPISGRVKGDISVYGPGWIEDSGLLRMGPATTASGGTSRLNINIRGKHAGATTLRVERVDPPELQATLGEPHTIREGLVRVPLAVSIAPGTPPMVRAGDDQGGFAEVVLATTHPDTAEVRMRVTFTVQP